jgi:hypothetical protein
LKPLFVGDDAQPDPPESKAPTPRLSLLCVCPREPRGIDDRRSNFWFHFLGSVSNCSATSFSIFLTVEREIERESWERSLPTARATTVASVLCCRCRYRCRYRYRCLRTLDGQHGKRSEFSLCRTAGQVLRSCFHRSGSGTWQRHLAAALCSGTFIGW